MAAATKALDWLKAAIGEVATRSGGLANTRSSPAVWSATACVVLLPKILVDRAKLNTAIDRGFACKCIATETVAAIAANGRDTILLSEDSGDEAVAVVVLAKPCFVSNVATALCRKVIRRPIT